MKFDGDDVVVTDLMSALYSDGVVTILYFPVDGRSSR